MELILPEDESFP